MQPEPSPKAQPCSLQPSLASQRVGMQHFLGYHTLQLTSTQSFSVQFYFFLTLSSTPLSAYLSKTPPWSWSSSFSSLGPLPCSFRVGLVCPSSLPHSLYRFRLSYGAHHILSWRTATVSCSFEVPLASGSALHACVVFLQKIKLLPIDSFWFFSFSAFNTQILFWSLCHF